jgi:hypothetical protein
MCTSISKRLVRALTHCIGIVTFNYSLVSSGQKISGFPLFPAPSILPYDHSMMFDFCSLLSLHCWKRIFLTQSISPISPDAAALQFNKPQFVPQLAATVQMRQLGGNCTDVGGNCTNCGCRFDDAANLLMRLL